MSKKALPIVFNILSFLFAISLYFVFAAEFSWATRSVDLYFGWVSLIYLALLLVGLFTSSKFVKLWLAIAGFVWLIFWFLVVFPGFFDSHLSILFTVQIVFGIAVFVWNFIGAFERQIAWFRKRSDVSI